MNRVIKLAIVGSRTFDHYEVLKEILDEFITQNNFTITSIISGGCRGVDRLAEKYSIKNHIDLITFKPEWGRFGKQAGIIRNHEIIKSSDVCLTFWDGVSRGTSHSITLCKKYHKPCWVYNFVTGGFI